MGIKFVKAFFSGHQEDSEGYILSWIIMNLLQMSKIHKTFTDFTINSQKMMCEDQSNHDFAKKNNETRYQDLFRSFDCK